MYAQLAYCMQLCSIVSNLGFVSWNIILPLKNKCLGCFTPHNFVFLLCSLTYKQEGCNVDSNNIRHLKESPSVVFFVFFLERFSGGQQIGLWLCWVTNCIFFSGNLCKVGSFVLTLILLFGICALYWPDHFYASEFFFFVKKKKTLM